MNWELRAKSLALQKLIELLNGLRKTTVEAKSEENMYFLDLLKWVQSGQLPTLGEKPQKDVAKEY